HFGLGRLRHRGFLRLAVGRFRLCLVRPRHHRGGGTHSQRPRLGDGRRVRQRIRQFQREAPLPRHVGGGHGDRLLRRGGFGGCFCRGSHGNSRDRLRRGFHRHVSTPRRSLVLPHPPAPSTGQREHHQPPSA